MRRVALAAAMLGLLAACDGPDRWTIADASFFPVAIDHWSDDRSFLVGSYEHGAVARMSDNGILDDRPYLPSSVAQDGRRRALRISVDGARDRLWVLDTDRVYVYSLRSRKLLLRIGLPHGAQVTRAGCLPDMTFNPFTGTVYVADGREPTLHAIYEDSSTEALVRTELRLHGDGRGEIGRISALAVVPGPHALLAGSAETGTLWRVDPLTGEARRIEVKDASSLRGICALRAIAASPLSHTQRGDAPHEFYFTSMTSNALYGLVLQPSLEAGRAVALTRAQALESPIGIAPIGGYVVATSSQLDRHKDLGGAAAPLMPFRLVAMPAAIGPLAADASIARRPLR
jgi:hypothetical protein